MDRNRDPSSTYKIEPDTEPSVASTEEGEPRESYLPKSDTSEGPHPAPDPEGAVGFRRRSPVGTRRSQDDEETPSKEVLPRH